MNTLPTQTSAAIETPEAPHPTTRSRRVVFVFVVLGPVARPAIQGTATVLGPVEDGDEVVVGELVH